MKVVILAVGRVKGELSSAVAGYEARASHYWKLEIVEVDGGAGGRESRSAVLAAEADRLQGLVDAVRASRG